MTDAGDGSQRDQAGAGGEVRSPVRVRVPTPRTPAWSWSTEPLLIFANRYARAVARLRGQRSLKSLAGEAGLEAEVVYTRSERHLRDLMRLHVVGKRGRVAVAGGDGTIHAAVQELAGTDVVLGILPQGTANNFAAALRLPTDLPSAFRVLAGGEERAVDLGEVEGEYFTEGAGVGLFADILAFMEGRHRAREAFRALRVVTGAFLVNRPRRFTLEADGETRVEDVLNVIVANSFSVGYNLPLAPGARVTDGLLDVVVIGSLERGEMLHYLRAIRRGMHLELPKVQSFRAREVRIHGHGGLTAHVDDRIVRHNPLAIRVAPGALRVLVERL